MVKMEDGTWIEESRISGEEKRFTRNVTVSILKVKFTSLEAFPFLALPAPRSLSLASLLAVDCETTGNPVHRTETSDPETPAGSVAERRRRALTPARPAAEHSGRYLLRQRKNQHSLP